MRKLLTTYISSQPEPTIIPLTFTAEEANSTLQLNKIGEPTVVELEISTDGNIWSDYIIGDTITLANVGDKVYMRNKSETDTGFAITGGNSYYFTMTGKIGASGDTTSLLNKNGTNTASPFCFFYLFSECPSLTTPPELPATTLAERCYHGMFSGCTNIKLSETQTGEYQIPYRIPTTGTGTDATNAFLNMFRGTGGTFTGNPTINTTYYLRSGAAPALLSYEEICAMSIADAITELNTYPTEYYNKFNLEGHISTKYTDSGLANSSNTGYQTWVNSLGNTVSAIWNIYSDSRWTEEVGYN